MKSSRDDKNEARIRCLCDVGHHRWNNENKSQSRLILKGRGRSLAQYGHVLSESLSAHSASDPAIRDTVNALDAS